MTRAQKLMRELTITKGMITRLEQALERLTTEQRQQHLVMLSVYRERAERLEEKLKVRNLL